MSPYGPPLPIFKLTRHPGSHSPRPSLEPQLCSSRRAAPQRLLGCLQPMQRTCPGCIWQKSLAPVGEEGCCEGSALHRYIPWPSESSLHLLAPSHSDPLSWPSPHSSLTLPACFPRCSYFFPPVTTLSSLFLPKAILLPQDSTTPPHLYFSITPHFVGPGSGVTKQTVEEAEE